MTYAFFKAWTQEIRTQKPAVWLPAIKYLHRPDYPLPGCSPAEPGYV